MTSTALLAWRSARAERLNRLQTAHATVGGSGPGRRWLTEEINHALVLRLAAEFQGFTRELHDEASMTIADTLSAGVSPRRDALGRALTSTRRLNRGNATAEVLAHDFGLLGLLLLDELHQRFGSAHHWRDRLRLLNEARNGLAHADQQKLDRVATVAQVGRLRCSPLAAGAVRWMRWPPASIGLPAITFVECSASRTGERGDR